jgi:hypothetical protein
MDVDPLFHAAIVESADRSQRRLLSILRPMVATEKLFLEMFEDEYYHTEAYY